MKTNSFNHIYVWINSGKSTHTRKGEIINYINQCNWREEDMHPQY